MRTAKRLTRYNNELFFEEFADGEWQTLPIEEIVRGLYEVSFYRFHATTRDIEEAFELYEDFKYAHYEQKRNPHAA